MTLPTPDERYARKAALVHPPTSQEGPTDGTTSPPKPRTRTGKARTAAARSSAVGDASPAAGGRGRGH